MIERENPARFAEIVGEVPVTSPEAVDEIVRRADADQRRWATTPLPDRLTALTRVADAIDIAIQDLATLLARESGKVRPDCLGELGFAVR
ncbi:hypothetical protein GCM10010168_91800 [Actinoplanes ianthinogenes]|uniref:Aldehyde dehydrogenase domain-containing protein n=1 Tax=Actinoplanes ianthinogenes TaxID=122358 RepID=A0ABM7LNF9_9ACTN|nr:aldehyde dehydrogenase family protein [Actinoplanes ianthinogenes]BCJ40796.1 hypothetical protein Aiant_14530 [Actinoplanes ianthinogenes]GGR58518.1 hypothetical protein GCM10010168_91800 [Actinoplanes ianthinogenes]